MPAKRKPHPAGCAPKPTTDTDSSTIYFYLPNARPYGVFCQWHPSPFNIPTSSLRFLTHSAPRPPPNHPTASQILTTHAPSIPFTCAEQSLMFCKALYFSSPDMCARIMASADPAIHKKLGRSVRGFSEWKWDKVKRRVARVGNWYKFTDGRNERLRRVLVGTGEREIVEASRRDRVWGCGYSEEEAEVYRELWGENLLGRCLGDVRGRIRGKKGMTERGEAEGWGEWDGDMGTGREDNEGKMKIDEEDNENNRDIEDRMEDLSLGNDSPDMVA
ncbi:hypothetical protein HBH51_031610 [Parastagonospora nodorum]|nr:hypothetical protein HBH51_031610 [Parastagonospora nodorum]